MGLVQQTAAPIVAAANLQTTSRKSTLPVALCLLGYWGPAKLYATDFYEVLVRATRSRFKRNG
jgi:hypothetical protein